MVSKYFIVQEFVPPEIYKQFGDMAWQFIDPRLVTLADYIREYFGKAMTINNWDSGGTLSLRGFRLPDTEVGGRLSQHKFGRAFDFNLTGITPQESYSVILKNKKSFMAKGLTTVENIDFTHTWNHVDVRYTGKTDLFIVNP